jgi:hypothetical protein
MCEKWSLGNDEEAVGTSDGQRRGDRQHEDQAHPGTNSHRLDKQLPGKLKERGMHQVDAVRKEADCGERSLGKRSFQSRVDGRGADIDHDRSCR